MIQSTQDDADVSAPVWTEHPVQVDGAALRCLSCGDGEVLLVIGSAVSPALELLAADRRVIVVDPAADLAAESDASPREAAARIVAVGAALGGGPLAVLATGEDAAAALWAAVDRPDLVRTLVLEAPAVFSVAGMADPELAEAMALCEVPTLVLLGQRDPAAGPRFAGDYKRLRASSVAIVYAAGADISGQRPAAFADTVRDYLQRGQAFVLSTASTLIHA